MLELVKEKHSVFNEFYTGTKGTITVNCILDDNCVRFIVFEGRRVLNRREYKNNGKRLCFIRATQALNNTLPKSYF